MPCKNFRNNLLASIIIPIYNMESYLDECLSSIEKQKWQENDIEVICVDDGSKDNSLAICRKHSEKYPYIHVIHKNNGGVSTARNAGLDIAKGKYIIWIDPDDYIAESFWQKIKSMLIKDYDLIFFDHYRVYDYGIKRRSYDISSHDIKQELFIKELHDGVKIASYLPTKITKRFLWDNVKFPENISLGEDSAVLPYVMLNAKKIYYLHDALYFYRQHSESICHSSNINDVLIAYHLVENREKFFLQHNFDISEFGRIYKAYSSLLYMVGIREKYIQDSLFSEVYCKFLDIVKDNKKILWESANFSYKDKIKTWLIINNMPVICSKIQYINSILIKWRC